jgi:hypothetical protein
MERVEILFVVLGILDEYMGHPYNPDDDVVERFYPAEGELAEQFSAWLVRLAAERGIATTVRTENTESGHISIHSRELAELISNCYRDRRPCGYIDSNAQQLYLNEEFFREAGVSERLSFLAGAYARFGKDTSFVYANAPHKAELTRLLLQHAGGLDLVVSTNPKGYVPRIDTVSFAASPEFAVTLALPRLV